LTPLCGSLDPERGDESWENAVVALTNNTINVAIADFILILSMHPATAVPAMNDSGRTSSAPHGAAPDRQDRTHRAHCG
jgi:hypothetical protein